MPINILMPALSPTMEKGNLAKWLKKEGDKVKSGDVIAEIETDKATMEVEAVDEGTIAKIVVPEGTQDVAVNDVIAVLAGDGEDVKAAGVASQQPKAEAKAEAKAETKAEAPKESAPAREPAKAAAPAPVSAPPLQSRETAPQSNGHGRIFSSPLARRLAKEAGIELARINGSGPHGRIIARDVEEARSGKGLKAPAAAPAGAPAIAPSMSDKQIRALFEDGQLRGHPARRHAPHHCTASDRLGANHPAFLPDDGLQHRQAGRGPRGDQRRGAQGQGRQAGLQALGQRFRHQGAGAGAAADTQRQCQLDRRRHAQAQAFRRRRRRGDARRPDHADHPQGRDQAGLGDLSRDEGFCGARPSAQSSSRRNIRAAPRLYPTSACTASIISPP